MTEKETTSGGAVWRKRAIASVSVAAAVCAMGVGFASSANAAGTAPTLKVIAPATIANDGTSGANQLFSVEVNNSQSGNDTIPPATVPNGAVTVDALTVKFTVPAGVDCANVQLTGGTATPAAAVAPAFTVTGTSPACSATAAAFTQPANSDYKFTYQLTVNTVGGGNPTGLSGTVSSSAVLSATTNGVASTVATSNTAASVLAAPSAPSLAAVPPAATIYNNYSYQEVSSVGVPPTPQTLNSTPGTAGYSIFAAPTLPQADGTFAGGNYLTTATTDSNTGDVFATITTNLVGANFFLDLKTGTIVTGNFLAGVFVPGAVSQTASVPALTYTITANNGKGGATVASPGLAAGSTARPTPGVGLKDVQSAPFTLTVLFSDVTTASTFGSSIYGLSNTNGIAGFADGTFRPAQAVTRGEFVQIIFRSMGSSFPGGGFVGTGECTTFEPSAFPDVPNSSPFCEAIKQLNQVGIVKGSTDGLFHPSAQISREQIAGFTYRSYSVATTGTVAADATFTSPSPFSDVTSSNIFGGDIEFLAGKKIVGGFTDGTFHPKATANRGETAAFIYRTQQAAL